MTKNPGNIEEKARKSGSPQSGEPLSIAIGKIRRTHGVKGELVYEPFAEYSVKFKKGDVLLIGKKQDLYTLRSIRSMDQNYLLSFEGLDDCDVVSFLRNQLVYLKTDQLEKPAKGKHYPHQVLGMQVINEKGESIGRLEEVLITGANDVYVVRPANSTEEILIPAIDSVLLDVDSEKKVITVKLPIWD